MLLIAGIKQGVTNCLLNYCCLASCHPRLSLPNFSFIPDTLFHFCTFPVSLLLPHVQAEPPRVSPAPVLGSLWCHFPVPAPAPLKLLMNPTSFRSGSVSKPFLHGRWLQRAPPRSSSEMTPTQGVLLPRGLAGICSPHTCQSQTSWFLCSGPV